MTVATPATVTPTPPPSVANVASVNVANDETESGALSFHHAPKPETLQDRQREARRQKVIAMLEAAPDTQRAIYVDDASDPANIILAIAVRYPTGATCEMQVSKAGHDVWQVMEFIEQHGATTH